MADPGPMPPDPATLPGGEILRMRPLEPGDEAAMTGLFEALSPDSVYFRFLAPYRHAEPRYIRRLLRIDHVTEEAIGGFLDEGDGPRLVGVARWKATGPGEAEMAVVVADRWHRHGVGRALVCRASAAAARLGIDRFVAPVDPANLAVLALARACCSEIATHYDNGLLRLSVRFEPRA